MLQKKNQYDALEIGGCKIPEIRYADYAVLLSTSQNGLEQLISSVQKNSEEQTLYLNVAKTKIMPTDKPHVVNEFLSMTKNWK
jgi:hypothetical protein